ncbi:MAG: hypothetical protein IJZ81_03770 [Clostridia bacterium]|nr:hypothetical protein [Clostridia bacterium]
MKLAYVKKDWLTRRAKTIETKMFKEDKKAPSWTTILNRLSRCIVESEKDFDTIDYDKYLDIRKRILNKQTVAWGCETDGKR